MTDIFLLVVVGLPLAIMALWLLFSLAIPPAPPPKPAGENTMLVVERATLIAAVDLELQAAELRLRSGGMVVAAEGANLVRTRAVEFLKGYKP